VQVFGITGVVEIHDPRARQGRLARARDEGTKHRKPLEDTDAAKIAAIRALRHKGRASAALRASLASGRYGAAGHGPSGVTRLLHLLRRVNLRPSAFLVVNQTRPALGVNAPGS
jgi:hypothetical protein